VPVVLETRQPGEILLAVHQHLVQTSSQFLQAHLAQPVQALAVRGVIATTTMARRETAYLPQAKGPLAVLPLGQPSQRLASAHRFSRRWALPHRVARYLHRRLYVRVPHLHVRARMAAVVMCLRQAHRQAEPRLLGRGCLQGLARLLLVVTLRARVAPAVRAQAPRRE